MATERSAGRRLTDAFLARDAPAMVAELAPDAVFHPRPRMTQEALEEH